MTHCGNCKHYLHIRTPTQTLGKCRKQNIIIDKYGLSINNCPSKEKEE